MAARTRNDLEAAVWRGVAMSSFVTVNHRLNILGISICRRLSAEYAGSGNAGVLDLIAALNWVGTISPASR